MKNKKKIEEAVNYIEDLLNNSSHLQTEPESQRKFKKALEFLTENQPILQIKVTGRFSNKCFFCNSSDLKNNCFNLTCDCFNACHRTCLKNTVILMSPDLNTANIRINCDTCGKYIPFERILSLFSEEEMNDIKNKYFCKFCDKAIPAESIQNSVKYCPCQQMFHRECIKKNATKASRGLYEKELNENLLCWHCKHPIPFEVVRQCFSDKEFKSIQEEDQSLKFIEELERQDKEARKEAARKKTAKCPICEENKIVETEMITLNCEHMFCIECLKQFCNAQVAENKVQEVDLACSHCRKPISIHILKNVMDPEIFERYESYNLQHNQSKIIGGEEIALRCPNANCKNFFVMDKNSGVNFHVCEMCKLDFCVHGCKHPHRKMTCTQYQEHLAELRRQEEERRLAEIARIAEEARRAEEMRKFNEWKAENDRADEQFNLLVAREKLANCPRCYIWVQKISGCNHITCNKCHHQFCYVCKTAEWSKCGHQNQRV